MHPQASYYDAFWQESCSGSDLGKYFTAGFESDTRWYRPLDEIIPTPNGVIVRYEAFDRDDNQGVTPILNGAEVLTLSEGLIMTISDYYCDPAPADLIEVASLAEGQHGRANVIQRGLGAQSAGRIKRQLSDVATGAAIILAPDITVTKLADYIGCSVMHLFHVLEDVQGTTFLDFVNGSRARHASTMMIDRAVDDVRFDRIAEQCGFESIMEFKDAFRLTFGMTADEYIQRFAK
jgi:AraC-like DNA-binding protein